jgi:hypothetical protein
MREPLIDWLPLSAGEPMSPKVNARATVTVKEMLRCADPSLTVTVIVAVPVELFTGVTVTVRFAPLPPNTMLFVGTRAVLDELRDSVSFDAEVWPSPMVKVMAPELPFAAMVRFEILLIVGAVFVPDDEPTVTTKLSEPLSEPSLARTVTVAVPVRPACGVKLSVREPPLPPSVRRLLGRSV